MLVAIGAGASRPVLAVDPARAMTQYLRDRWDSETAFPGGAVYAITQARDGYLWIAGEKGLVRFDGLRFQLLQPQEVTAGADSTVVGLAAADDGGLWALLRRAALVRLRGSQFEPALPNPGRPNAMVTAMTTGQHGGVIAVDANRGVLMEQAGSVRVILEPPSLPGSFVIALAETRDRQLWLGTRDSGLLRVNVNPSTPLGGNRVERITKGLPDQKINTLLPRRRGSDVWIGTDSGLAVWNGTEVTAAGVPSLSGLQILTMLEDRDGNVWIGTASNGLFRVAPHGAAARAVDPGHDDESVTALFEDRDGNIWIGTTRGLERLRDAVFTTYSTTEGLPSDRVGAVYVDARGQTWFAPLDGGLFCFRDGRVVPIADDGLANDVVYAIAGGPRDVWIGRQRGGLTRIPLAGGSPSRLTQSSGLAQNSVYAVHRARDGAMWAGTLSGGVTRYHDGSFTTYTAANGLASNMVAAILDTADGAMWFATPNGLSRLQSDRWDRYSVNEGLPSNEVNALLEDRSGRVWIGTAAGLAFGDGREMRAITGVSAVTRGAILGLAEDPAGSLWIVTAEGILRADRDQLVRGQLVGREFAAADGLLSRQGVKRSSSIAVDPAGRVWIATSRGLSVTDPASAAGRAAPALIQFENLSADGVAATLTDPVRIGPGPQRIRIAYAGLSLSVPDRVMFRYRLDGFDRDWSVASTRREAEYTNLGPGHYRFRVVASNSDGVWNGAEVSIPFDVDAAFWQTRTFQAAVVALAGVVAWGGYRLRLRRMTSRLNERFEERLAERTRIAQELHDTLLQGVVSASMQLHVVADRLPADSAERHSLDRVLTMVRRVVDEGRNAVRGLRSADSAAHNLEDAFSGIPQELALAETPGYRVIVDGKPRPLNPIIRDEVYRIGREALVNAFRHARATHVEVELEYAAELRLCVRDDGQGIDARVLQRGSDGHWGLTGMRERAQRIGARLKVWSRETAGTEIELSVPGRVAYREPRP